MTTNTEHDVLALIETYLPPLLPGGMSYSPEASKILHDALIRDYVEDDFSMREHVDSPFSEAKGFQLHASYNERDFRVPELDMLQHLQTFEATALPRKPYKHWAAACVYPLPPRVGANWVQDENGKWMEDGECDFNKGNFSFAIVYFDQLPVMDWTPPAFEPNDLRPSSYYARELVWHEEERNGTREISDYLRNTQIPYDLSVYIDRQSRGIPLTPYQQKVVDAGGWPYPGVAPAPEPEPEPGRADPEGDIAKVAADLSAPEPEALREKYADVIAEVRGFMAETHHGEAHVERWSRVLAALGVDNGFDPMSAAEAEGYAARGWKRWGPVASVLREIEAPHGS